MPDIVKGTFTGPATHALVVGVSNYPYTSGPRATELGKRFQVGNLTSAARSASNVARWILREHHNPDAPLKTLRILLSPSPGESIHPDIAKALPAKHAATVRAVQKELLAFREDMRAEPNNRGIVYFAGHGVQQNKRGVTVLLEDFAKDEQLGVLGASVDVGLCRLAMDAGDTPGTQFWFADACRQPIALRSEFESLSAGYSLPDERRGEADASIFFLAASSEESAYATRGGSTIFSEALLWALKGPAILNADGSCPTWHIGSARLSQLLPTRVNQLLATSPQEQRVVVTGTTPDRPIQIFERPPKVPLTFELDPSTYTPMPEAKLVSGNGPTVWRRRDWPIRSHVDPGLYCLNVNDRQGRYFTAGHFPEHLEKVVMPQ